MRFSVLINWLKEKESQETTIRKRQPWGRPVSNGRSGCHEHLLTRSPGNSVVWGYLGICG